MKNQIVEVRIVTHGGFAVCILFRDEAGEIKSTQALQQFRTFPEAEYFVEGMRATIGLAESGFLLSRETRIPAPVEIPPQIQ